MRSWTKWVLLLALVGNAAAQNEVPDEDFLAFLGGLEADDDWEVFFESVPDDMPDDEALAEAKQDGAEDDNELD